MCGISGLISWQNSSLNLQSIGSDMNKQLNSRGPDDAGIYYNNKIGVLINHTRLSINDLSKNGHQPMESISKRYILSFNGEIYNFHELKLEIENSSYPINWSGTSDSEVLMAAIDKWGLEIALNKAIGMFAIALYDKESEQIILARDRFGEKPLYWGFPESGNNSIIIFGSDLTVFKTFKRFQNKVCNDALSLFINYSYIPSPYSIYENIWKLNAGHLLKINLPLNEKSNDFISKPWWELKDIINLDSVNLISNEIEAKNLIERELKQSVQYQSKADVNVTSFLSGGIDSSLITALLQSSRSTKINTYTVGFENENYNEAPFAKTIAGYLGTSHNELILTNEDALSIVPLLSNFYSEPFADPAAIPTYLMCKAAANSGFKVALSGDGADELFGGYNRYTLAPKVWKFFNKLHPRIRPLVTSLIKQLPSGFEKFISMPQFKERVEKLSDRLNFSNSIDELYQLLIREWNDISIIIKDNNFNLKYNIAVNTDLKDHNLSDVSRMMVLDCLSYLSDNNQVKIDRAAMAVSLETRSPFLDKNVAVSSWKISESLKIKNAQGKYILREILSNYIPRNLFDRHKSGFATPIKDWLRGPLKEWSMDLMNTSTLKSDGYLNEETVKGLWDDHINLKMDNSKKLWPILMWQAWNIDNK